ncbi:MAG: prepilin-type N-terminal cleavage/methylation domain-containing protein [Armatimonadetes bacterium]|nr:prepilin-type N-terminal cleavage/methylation domain-containing protein [Armatimonadota bacterium]
MVRRQRGFTLIELLVVIAIILILAAILFPVFAKVRSKALQTTCLNNLKQLGIACEMYQSAWGDVLVPYGAPFAWTPNGMWPMLLNPYLKQITADNMAVAGNLGKLFRCPAAQEEEIAGWAFERSYGMNTYCGGWQAVNPTPAQAIVVSTSKAKYPSQTIRIAETEWRAVGGSFFAALPSAYVDNDPTCHRFATRHNDQGCVLWIDGHVSTMTMATYLAPAGYTRASAVWLRLTGPKPNPS